MAFCNEDAAAQCGATRGSALVLTEAPHVPARGLLASLSVSLFTFFATAAFLPLCL